MNKNINKIYPAYTQIIFVMNVHVILLLVSGINAQFVLILTFARNAKLQQNMTIHS